MQTIRVELAIPDPLRDVVTLAGIGACAWVLLTFMGTPAPALNAAGLVFASACRIRS